MNSMLPSKAGGHVIQQLGFVQQMDLNRLKSYRSARVKKIAEHNDCFGS